jgi:glyoxylase-like metal-dependent hydrolase (beta-lactamase superfamily II)
MNNSVPKATIGELQVSSIIDGSLSMDPVTNWTSAAEVTKFFERSTYAPGELLGFESCDWEARSQFLEQHGELRFEYGGYLIRGSGDRLILVDLGLGPPTPASIGVYDALSTFEASFLKSLRLSGVDPLMVSDVLLTHLHRDHIGWAAQGGSATFPNATYHCNIRDWEYFTDRKKTGHLAVDPDPDMLYSIESHISVWDEDQTIFPGVDLVLAPGHTPGSAMVILSSGGARGVLLGDIVHCPVQLVESDWAGMGDVDPAMASATRERLSREYADGETMMAGGHFPGLKFGRLVQSEVDRKWSLSSAAPA